jgi:hypothetical protein
MMHELAAFDIDRVIDGRPVTSDASGFPRCLRGIYCRADHLNELAWQAQSAEWARIADKVLFQSVRVQAPGETSRRNSRLGGVSDSESAALKDRLHPKAHGS